MKRLYTNKYARSSLIGLTLLLSFFLACSKNSDDPTVVTDGVNEPTASSTTSTTLPTIAWYECGGATFTSDTFVVGSINGQNGWYADPAAHFDESIVNLGSEACRGSQVWKINNSVTSSGFGNQPISPAFSKSSGESSVRSVGGGDSMAVSFFIRTVSSGADGSSFTVSLSPTSADRHTYLRITNDDNMDGGFQLVVVDGTSLVSTIASFGISRGEWHHVKMENTNYDGAGNDVFKVYLDGNLVATRTTWEDWRTALPSPTLAVTRVLFRIAGAAGSYGSFGSPQGFYLDDFVQFSYDSSAPNVVIEKYQTGFE